jgi:TRAP-type C4-dicarboxylate transport system permease small subunit
MKVAERALATVIVALAILAGVILAVVTTMLTANVAMRAFAGRNIYGMVDAIEIGLMASTFLAAPWVLMKNAHVSVDIVLMTMTSAKRARVEWGMNLVGAVLSAIFCWASIRALIIAWDRGSMIRGVLIVPEWVTLMAPSIGAALLALEFLRRAYRGGRSDRFEAGL